MLPLSLSSLLLTGLLSATQARVIGQPSRWDHTPVPINSEGRVFVIDFHDGFDQTDFSVQPAALGCLGYDGTAHFKPLPIEPAVFLNDLHVDGCANFTAHQGKLRSDNGIVRIHYQAPFALKVVEEGFVRGIGTDFFTILSHLKYLYWGNSAEPRNEWYAKPNSTLQLQRTAEDQVRLALFFQPYEADTRLMPGAPDSGRIPLTSTDAPPAQQAVQHPGSGPDVGYVGVAGSLSVQRREKSPEDAAEKVRAKKLQDWLNHESGLTSLPITTHQEDAGGKLQDWLNNSGVISEQHESERREVQEEDSHGGGNLPHHHVSHTSSLPSPKPSPAPAAKLQHHRAHDPLSASESRHLLNEEGGDHIDNWGSSILGMNFPPTPRSTESDIADKGGEDKQQGDEGYDIFPAGVDGILHVDLKSAPPPPPPVVAEENDIEHNPIGILPVGTGPKAKRATEDPEIILPLTLPFSSTTSLEPNDPTKIIPAEPEPSSSDGPKVDDAVLRSGEGSPENESGSEMQPPLPHLTTHHPKFPIPPTASTNVEVLEEEEDEPAPAPAPARKGTKGTCCSRFHGCIC